jgi:predicted lipid-binding transport protein (Tim44 family)
MDILFFALLSAYIFFKLSKHLGKIDEQEKKQIEEKIIFMRDAQDKMQEILKQQEKLVGSASTIKSSVNQNEVEESLKNLNSESKSNVSEILSRCNIDLPFFLTGAKSAFEMVIKSFSSGDLETLKSLLSERLYQGFEFAVNARISEEKTLTTNLIVIKNSDIFSASLEGNIALITVKFVSKQINYISLKTGEVVEGKKDEISEVTDIWTFKKDITSPDPNWVISQTGN